MLIPILIGLAVLVAIFLIVVSLQPAKFRYTRSTTIGASPAVVFGQVNDFHCWGEWSPWAKMDPNAQNSFEGEPAGVGAKFAWAGNRKVGVGQMTVTESRPPERILIKLEFFKPFQATHTAEFTFKAEGSHTLVTWTMSGDNNFIGKAMNLFVNCDKMIGGQFEKGLFSLKAIAEARK